MTEIQKQETVVSLNFWKLVKSFWKLCGCLNTGHEDGKATWKLIFHSKGVAGTNIAILHTTQSQLWQMYINTLVGHTVEASISSSAAQFVGQNSATAWNCNKGSRKEKIPIFVMYFGHASLFSIVSRIVVSQYCHALWSHIIAMHRCFAFSRQALFSNIVATHHCFA